MKDEFKPGDRVEVRDHDYQEWNPAIFVAMVDLRFPYLITVQNAKSGFTCAQCRHEIVDDAEMARREKIAELIEEIAELKEQLAKLQNQ